MKKVTFGIDDALYNMLGLTNTADEVAIGAAIKQQLERAKSVDTLNNKITTLSQDNVRLQNELGTLQVAAQNKAVEDLIADGLKDGRLTNESSAAFKTQFAGNPAGLKAILDTMKPFKAVTETIEKQQSGASPKNKAELIKAYDEAFADGTLADIRDSDMERYKEMYMAKFNVAIK